MFLGIPYMTLLVNFGLSLFVNVIVPPFVVTDVLFMFIFMNIFGLIMRKPRRA